VRTGARLFIEVDYARRAAEELREEFGVIYEAYGGTAIIKTKKSARGLVSGRTITRLFKEINYIY